jgi:hypothetical protein
MDRVLPRPDTIAAPGLVAKFAANGYASGRLGLLGRAANPDVLS